MMMNVRTFAVILPAVAATTLLIAPATSQAAAYQKAMDACMTTFVSEHLPEGHPVKIVKRTRAVGFGQGVDTSRNITVSAKGTQSGASYGSATCVVDQDGALVSLYVEGTRIRVADVGAMDASSGS
jgi:hypothetical protein